MDFAGLMFDDAIRTFLSGFRLPGEAQKVSQVSQLFNNRISLIMLIS
jgi:brefeldin A-inhibited guanine nucleotide-exchange protein